MVSRRFDALWARVLDDLFSDKELASGKIDFGLASIFDLLKARFEVLQHVAGRR
jgi:hypothetical protein